MALSYLMDRTSDAALTSGDWVKLRGFGAFSIRRRSARVERNPLSGASVNGPEKHLPVLKTGMAVRTRLNPQVPKMPAATPVLIANPPDGATGGVEAT